MFYPILTTMSQWLIPLFLLFVFLHAYWKKVKVYDAFIEGAGEGFWMALKILPYVVGIYVAISLFRESGALIALGKIFAPFLGLLGVPEEILPLALVRPLSGPAALGLTLEILERFGPDSFIGRLATTLDGSTDTTFYIIAVYFASVGVKRPRYSIPVGLIADTAGLLAAIFICHRVFG